MCKVSLTLIDGIPLVSLMKMLGTFAERLMTTNLRLHELKLKRIGHANTSDKRMVEDHHIAINKLVAVTSSLVISFCAVDLNLNM